MSEEWTWRLNVGDRVLRRFAYRGSRPNDFRMETAGTVTAVLPHKRRVRVRWDRRVYTKAETELYPGNLVREMVPDATGAGV